MKHAHDILRARLHARIDAHGKPPARAAAKYTMEQLQGQWHDLFETLMRNRLQMGALRYGLNFCNAAGKPQYDRLQGAIKRLELYQETGNDELLVDVANLMMLEFGEGKHAKKHFEAVDGDSRIAVHEA
jgi:hypothetical protein